MPNLFIDNLSAKIAAIRRSQYFAAAILIFVTLVMWEVVNIIVSGQSIATAPLVLSIIAFTLWCAVFALSFLLLEPRWFAYIVYFLAGLILFPLFAWQEWPIIGIIAFIIFTISAFQNVSNEREMLASFRLGHILKQGLPSFFTGVAILLAFVYYFSPYGAVTSQPEIPRAIVDLSFIPIDIVATTTIYGYEPGITVGQFQSLMIRNLLPRFVPSASPLQITAEIEREYRVIKDDEILKKSLPQFVYEKSNAYLARIIEPYKGYLPIFFVFTSFLTFKVLSIPFVWFTELAAWGLMKLLIALGIAEFGREQIERERLVLK